MTLQIVTATSGMVLLPALRTVITRCVCWESFWEAGKLAWPTATGNLPLGSLAAWFWPPPQADTANAVPAAAMIPQILTLRTLNAGESYHAVTAAKPAPRRIAPVLSWYMPPSRVGCDLAGPNG